MEGGGYDQAPVPLTPLTLKDMEHGGRGPGLPLRFDSIWDMQATMLQPVGGMDRIAHAIYEPVKPVVRLNTPVTAIRRVGNRVRIEHGPGKQMTETDYCICTLPLPILGRIPSDFSAAKKTAIAGGPAYLHSVKLAFEAPRFWETDDNIFGGLAWTDRLNENVIYPSHNYGASKGIVVGAYCAGWNRRGHAGLVRGAVARGAHSDQPRVDGGVAPGSVASATQTGDRRVGADAVFRRRRCALARL